MQGITVDQLMIFAIVGCGLLGVYNLAMTAIKNHADAKKTKEAPVNGLSERVEALEENAQKIEHRIITIETAMDMHDDEMKLLLRGQLALLRHGIDGNNIQGLKDSQNDIQKYLVDKKGVIA